MAPCWRRLGDGQRGRAQGFRLHGGKGLPRIGKKLRELGVRPYGVVRINSATGVHDWAQDPAANTKLIAQTFREACDVAEKYGERLAAEGEICWGGMHGWKSMAHLLEAVAPARDPGISGRHGPHAALHPGLQCARRAHPASGLRLARQGGFQFGDEADDEHGRTWTIDFHVAQNDATVKGSGSHDKTGRHCTVDDPNGKLDIVYDAGYWLRDENGALTKAIPHICWDGCMFPNEVMTRQKTWNDILGVMVKVRDAHGWHQ